MTELYIRTSERTTFKECRAKWYWSYVRCLTRNQSGKALAFGGLIHNALDPWYKPGKRRGVHPAETFAQLIDQYEAEHGLLIMKENSDDPYDSKNVNARELGLAMLNGYVEKYGKDQQFEVVSSEMPFQIDVKDKRGLYVCTYLGKFDSCVRDLNTGKIGLLEHKTTGTTKIIKTPLQLDEQSGSYWAMGTDFLRDKGVLKSKEELEFILFNGLRKALPDDRPENDQGLKLNKDGSVSKKQPPPLFMRELVHKSPEARTSIIDRVVQEAKEIGLARRGKLAIYKNPAEHCNWCQFRDMCEVHEEGSDWQAIRDMQFTTGDPYEDHRMALEEA